MNLKDYLKSKDKSKFAKQIGTTKNYLNLLIYGIRRPSPELAKKIEIATQGKVSRWELLYPEEYITEVTNGNKQK